MADTRDPQTVGRHDDEHLRRFAAARADGDTAAMRRHWEAIVTAIFDRVDGLVATSHKGQLDDDEHELAVEMSLARISVNLMHSFRGSTMGELVNTLKTLTSGICIDVQRQSIAARRRENRSLDDGWDVDAEDGPTRSWERDKADRDRDDRERSAEISEFFGWALPQLAGQRRDVMALTLAGLELPEICSRLDISRDNAYQLRSRGTRDLAKLKQQYDAS